MKERINQFRRRAATYLGRSPVPMHSRTGVLSLSFDDFPKSAWTVAGPILEAHAIKATYYVAGGMCDGSNLGKVQFSERDLQDAFSAGHEVGCHTYSHTSVLDLDAARLRHELDRNDAWVSERLNGYKMSHFAYPFGDVSIRAKRVLGERFVHSRSVRDGVNANGTDRNNLQAIGLESRRLPYYDLDALVAQTAASGGWLIAYGHDVEDRPTDYGCTPQDLERLILLAKAAGLDIKPVSRAYSTLTN